MATLAAPRLLTVRETAERLAVSQYTVADGSLEARSQRFKVALDARQEGCHLRANRPAHLCRCPQICHRTGGASAIRGVRDLTAFGEPLGHLVSWIARPVARRKRNPTAD